MLQSTAKGGSIPQLQVSHPPIDLVRRDETVTLGPCCFGASLDGNRTRSACSYWLYNLKMYSHLISVRCNWAIYRIIVPGGQLAVSAVVFVNFHLTMSGQGDCFLEVVVPSEDAYGVVVVFVVSVCDV